MEDLATWMWGDAGGLLGHAMARINPLRWSNLAGLEYAAAEIEASSAQCRGRPVRIRFLHEAEDSPSESSLGVATEEVVFKCPAQAAQALREKAAVRASDEAAAGRPPLKRRRTSSGAIVRAQFVVGHEGKADRIDDFYDMGKVVGTGGFGSVKLARRKGSEDGEKRAVKMIKRQAITNVGLFNTEIEIMRDMDHPNVVKLFETFVDAHFVYLAMELCTGGELFDAIVSAGHFTEKQAATVTQQMLRAVNHVHSRGVVHRDLKPENFLFQAPGDISEQTLKLTDFGLSCRFEPGEALTERVGTASYVAPEVLGQHYSSPCDLWGCGVLIFIFLSGRQPFLGDSDTEVLEKVKQGDVSLSTSSWSHVSDDAKQLVKGLLTKDSSDRFTAEQALQHEWVLKLAPKASAKPLPGLVDSLRSFHAHHILKKAALQAIARDLGESEIGALRDVFVAMDANGDGMLTAVELRNGLQQQPGAVSAELIEILQNLDVDRSGSIDYSEFIAAAISRKQYLEESRLWAAFRVFDKDGDGFITEAELGDVLGLVGEHANPEKLSKLMSEVDTNGDGHIDFQEFQEMMKRQGRPDQ